MATWLGLAMRSLGQNPREAELLDMINAAGAEEDGTVYLPALMSLLAQRQQAEAAQRQQDGAEPLWGEPAQRGQAETKLQEAQDTSDAGLGMEFPQTLPSLTMQVQGDMGPAIEQGSSENCPT